MNGRRLAAVLRVRTLQERGARGELARSSEQLRQAAQAEQRTWTSLDRPSPSASLTSQEVAAGQARRAAGLLAASSQHQITGRAEAGLEIARDEWTVAARRVEALERLDERNRENDALEFERNRNKEIDDMVLARRGRGPAATAAVNGAQS